MKPHAKVAVIIPFYNVEKYLSECLDSVINQSYKNLSIILVDDGSSDKSADIALDYFKRDSRISLLYKANGGQGSARNAALEYLDGGFDFRPLNDSRDLAGIEGIESKKLEAYFFKATIKPTARSLAYSTLDYPNNNGDTNSSITKPSAMGGGGGSMKSLN